MMALFFFFSFHLEQPQAPWSFHHYHAVSVCFSNIRTLSGSLHSYRTATATSHTKANRQDFCRIFPMCELKALLGCGAAADDVWKGWDQSYFVWHCCSQSHTDNSQQRLLTQLQTVRNSLMQKWRDELTCITARNPLEYTLPCMNQCRV